jgi:AcrR family transcriptional regulator
VSESKPKRRYDNTLRQAQARATAGLVVDAATELFVEKGYAATSIEGIAELAGVPIATVYRLLGSKAVMLREVLGTAISDEPAFEVPSSPSGPAEADDVLEALARFTRDLHAANGHLYGVLRSATGADADAAALLARTDARREEAFTAVGEALAERGALADDLDVGGVADVLHALLSAEVHRLLTRERGWTDDQYESWLVDTLRNQLLAPVVAAAR